MDYSYFQQNQLYAKVVIIAAAVAVILLILIAVIVIIRNAIQRRREKIVWKTSEKLQKLDKLNAEFNEQLYDISPSYHYEKYCRSLSEFRKYENTDLFLKETIQDNYSMFSELILLTANNKEKYREYLNAIVDLQETTLETINASGIPSDIYVIIEEQLCEEDTIVDPATSFSCIIQVDYISPKGRNHYRFKHEYPYDYIVMLHDTIKLEWSQEKEYMRTTRYERSRMTLSMRYNVMQRDGFRCVLCGASREDGVKLHVDHIKPIAKGGKTEMSNLRTLCDRCNFGKRDKYDPYGLN